MASRTITAEAVITARDATGTAFEAVAKKINGIARSAKASVEVDKLATSLKKAHEQAEKLDRFKGGMGAFAETRRQFRQAQGDVERAARDLASARQKAASYDGVKGFGKRGPIAAEIEVARRQAGQLEAEYNRAQRVVRGAAQSFERQKSSLVGLQRSLSGDGINVGKLSSEQARLKSTIDATNASIQRQSGLMKARAIVDEGMKRRVAELSADRAERSARRKEAIGTIAGAAGVMASHKVAQGARATLHTYREFDRERRFAKAVMGLTDAEQEPLVQQAIHGGATTKYNDIQWLEAQRELAARGLSKDQILGITPAAADLGQSLGLNLPDSVKQMEGALFGFKKDTSSLAASVKSARQTADLQVKAAKVSGMTPEDITQAYKYGATPARMSGVSEQMLLAFAGISKKANMGGDESGVAFRALIASAISPTRKAKEAYLANGMDFKNYQKNPDSLALDPFVANVAAQYGVKLNKKTQGALGSVFSNKDLIADPAKFAPAVMKLLSEQLGGDDAKSKKSIAGAANRYRDASMKGVDVNLLLGDLLRKIPGNIQLANAVFGSKQGARIATALGDPETLKKMLSELIEHSEGYAARISQERNAGFDGAVSRFQGATKNAETAVGRAWDKDGTGGPLTIVTDAAGRLVQGFAELNSGVVRTASELALLAGAASGVYGAKKLFDNLSGGFGLNASAALLDKSALALDAAAARLGVSGVAGTVAGAGAGAGAVAAGGAAAGTVARATLAGSLGFFGGALTAGYVGMKGLEYLDYLYPTGRPGARFSPYGNPLQGGRGAQRVSMGGVDGYPTSWGLYDVSGGAGAKAGSFRTNRERTWTDTANDFWNGKRGAKDPTIMELPYPITRMGLGPSQASVTAPYPPSRPAGAEGGSRFDFPGTPKNEELASGLAALAGGLRSGDMKATVTPDQIQAKVEGTLSGTINIAVTGGQVTGLGVAGTGVASGVNVGTSMASSIKAGPR